MTADSGSWVTLDRTPPRTDAEQSHGRAHDCRADAFRRWRSRRPSSCGSLEAVGEDHVRLDVRAPLAELRRVAVRVASDRADLLADQSRTADGQVERDA